MRPPITDMPQTERKTTRFGASCGSKYTRLMSIIWTSLNSDWLKSGVDCSKTLLTQLFTSGGSDCKFEFAHMGNISNIYCINIENGLRKLKTFIFSRLNVFVEVRLTKWVVEWRENAYLISPGSVETRVRRGGNWKHHFKPTSFRNMSAKNY